MVQKNLIFVSMGLGKNFYLFTLNYSVTNFSNPSACVVTPVSEQLSYSTASFTAQPFVQEQAYSSNLYYTENSGFPIQEHYTQDVGYPETFVDPVVEACDLLPFVEEPAGNLHSVRVNTPCDVPVNLTKDSSRDGPLRYSHDQHIVMSTECENSEEVDDPVDLTLEVSNSEEVDDPVDLTLEVSNSEDADDPVDLTPEVSGCRQPDQPPIEEPMDCDDPESAEHDLLGLDNVTIPLDYREVSSDHSEYVKTKGQFMIKPVAGNGACFYGAVSYGLHGSTDYWSVLRKQCHKVNIKKLYFFKIRILFYSKNILVHWPSIYFKSLICDVFHNFSIW